MLTAFAGCQGLLCFPPCPARRRLGVCEKLGGDTTKTVERYSVPYNVMQIHEDRGKGCLGQAAIAQGVSGSPCTCGGVVSDCLCFTSLGFFLSFLHCFILTLPHEFSCFCSSCSLLLSCWGPGEHVAVRGWPASQGQPTTAPPRPSSPLSQVTAPTS